MRVMGYWIVAVALLVFGFVAGFTIGQPFLLLGAAMLVVSPFRRRRLILWPALAAVVAFDIGYLAVAPFGCTATGIVGGVSSTVCSSLGGIHYAGAGTYNPSLLPALIVGLGCAGIAAIAVAGALWRGGARGSVLGDSDTR